MKHIIYQFVVIHFCGFSPYSKSIKKDLLEYYKKCRFFFLKGEDKMPRVA